MVTLALTALAILVACIWMALAIQNDLFQARKEQVLADSQRATQAAQATLDAAAVQGDSIQIQNLMTSVRDTLAERSSTDMIAAFRIDRTPSQLAPQNFTTPGLTEDVISDGMRDAVQSEANQQWWQSVSLPLADGTGPGHHRRPAAHGARCRRLRAVPGL